MIDKSKFYSGWADAALDAILLCGSGNAAAKDAAREDGMELNEDDLCKVLEIAHKQYLAIKMGLE